MIQIIILWSEIFNEWNNYCTKLIFSVCSYIFICYSQTHWNLFFVFCDFVPFHFFYFFWSFYYILLLAYFISLVCVWETLFPWSWSFHVHYKFISSTQVHLLSSFPLYKLYSFLFRNPMSNLKLHLYSLTSPFSFAPFMTLI